MIMIINNHHNHSNDNNDNSDNNNNRLHTSAKAFHVVLECRKTVNSFSSFMLVGKPLNFLSVLFV